MLWVCLHPLHEVRRRVLTECGELERLEDFINVAPVRFDSVESFLKRSHSGATACAYFAAATRGLLERLEDFDNIAPEKFDSEADCIKKVQADELHAAETASQASTRQAWALSVTFTVGH